MPRIKDDNQTPGEEIRLAMKKIIETGSQEAIDIACDALIQISQAIRAEPRDPVSRDRAKSP